MRSPLVVIEQPPVSDLANLVEITEQVLVQHLLSVCTVEAFDVGVLVRLASRQAVNHLHAVHSLAFLVRRQSFFSIRSFIARFSSARSAYMRFSLLFSASRSFTRRSSAASSPPYFDFHL